MFEKNSLSINSHEKASMEHYHTASLLDVLNDPSCDVLAIYSEDQAKKFKEFMVAAIMSTDMSRHFSIIEEFKVKKNKLSVENQQDKQVSLAI